MGVNVLGLLCLHELKAIIKVNIALQLQMLLAPTLRSRVIKEIAQLFCIYTSVVGFFCKYVMFDVIICFLNIYTRITAHCCV